MTALDANAFDATIEAWVLAHQTPAARTLFHWITVIGSVSPILWLGYAGVAVLAMRRTVHRAAALLVAPIGAIVAYTGLKRALARARPAGLGRIVEDTYSFPSAHATASASVCGALAYVMWREGLLPAPVALGFALLVPLLVGASRVYLDAHWATDVLGGWVIGAAIAASSGALYERARRSGR